MTGISNDACTSVSRFPDKMSQTKVQRDIWYMYLPQSLQILGIYIWIMMNYGYQNRNHILHKQVILIWYGGYIHRRISNMKTICSVKASGARKGCIMKLNNELGWNPPIYCQMWIAGDICLTHSAAHQPNANTPWIVDFSKYGAKRLGPTNPVEQTTRKQLAKKRAIKN